MKNVIIVALLSTIAFPAVCQTQKKYDSLELLIQGPISAYRSTTLRYYIERNDTLIYLPKTKEDFIIKNGARILRTTYPFRGLLNYYLHSCNAATSAVTKMTALTDTDLIKVLKKYYACPGNPQVSLKMPQEEIG